MVLKPYLKTLTSWGLLRLIERETLIDKSIQSIPLPNKKIQKSLNEQWCKSLKIDSNEKLKIWVARKI